MTTEKRAKYQEKMEAQLKEWGAKIEGLKARAEKASVDAQIQYHEQIEVLRTKYAAAEGKFSEFKTAGGHA